ncbi:SigB/SigF/SigG family RNA polymerase sigma factor [Mycobacterium sp. ITM-2016-00317]|uniref:SigB/SigF/SigG family RNA polymerase sigma factor n=1 Tax=Mycobacterium sp. ITM-2016-00317 TaxID=2099694 RepID=UPI00287F8940|nr:SigB/SigF/SigG family RNA polymerase sigma factor [Mycobacterium sp. ITM-2016-00317]WNG90129.1 SigB/SigF/SigG family RNA polymerase sigma factor [Mycobacterium sp. ITM-2016-00317]
MSASDGLDLAWVAAAFDRLSLLPDDAAEHARLRNEIIRNCLPLADRIARRYDRRGEAHEDLVQVARVGLINAVNRFDPAAGNEFLSFAVPTMLGEVKRYFRDCGWAVNVPRRLKDLYPALGQATAELTQRLGRSPNSAELAELLAVDRMDVVEALTAAAGFKTRSIDSGPTREDGSAAMIDRLGSPDRDIGFIDECDALRAQLASLPAREYRIVIMRFFESLTQSEIAARMGISQMHVSRLLTQSLTRLRNGMLDSDDTAIA